MPLHKVEIGGQIFEIICQEGEEDFLNAAAKLLDTEAQVFIQSQGNIGGSRMLLMAGLMLADRMGGLEEKQQRIEAEIEQRELAFDDRSKAVAREERQELTAKLSDKDVELNALQVEFESLKALQEKTEAELLEAKTSAPTVETVAPAEPSLAPAPSVDAKIADELEHKTAQVKDLTNRLVAASEKADAPKLDPFDMAMIEAERDEAEAIATAAKNEVERLKIDMEKLREERDARSRAETSARDELEAEISRKNKLIDELQERASAPDNETAARLEAAEKTIDRMVATAEAAAAELRMD